MKNEYIDYADGEATLEGFVASDEGRSGRRPCVLVSHAWGGQSDFERDKADELAALGYVGFALDIYGKGRRGTTMEENARLMQPFIDDRAMLRSRILAAVAEAKRHPLVDPQRIAAIGYCFGGLCVLDLARAAAPEVKGVVSFHGLFSPPGLGEQKKITAKILIEHGWDDPMATPENVLEITRELSAAGADWQLHAYGGTVHAFTNPAAAMPENGIVYREEAAKRSWQTMKNFLEEIFD